MNKKPNNDLKKNTHNRKRREKEIKERDRQVMRPNDMKRQKKGNYRVYERV